jgi:hypothetical protein
MSADILSRLRAADPAAGMPPTTEGDRERLRRAIVSTPVDSQRRPSGEHARPRFVVVAVVVAVLILLTGGAVYAKTVLLAPSPSFRQTASGWRQLPLDAAWKAALAKGVVALSRRASLCPLALGDDGRTFFAELYSKSYYGVVRVDAATSRVTRIWRFPNVRSDQASDGTFDGRWLVWSERRGFDDPGICAVWSWDSRTGRVRKIEAHSHGSSREHWSGSAVAVRDGLATWLQPAGPGGLSDVHVLNLASGRDRVVHRGYVDDSFFVDGGLVVWSESTKRGGPTVMKAADARTGAPAAVPTSLAALRNAAAPATDGAAIAYSDPHWSSLWWSPSRNPVPTRLFTALKNNPIDNSIAVAGRYISFAVAPRAYLADAVSRRYVQISPGGWALLGKKSLVIVTPSDVKALHVVSDIVFVPLSSLPAMPVDQ